MTEKVYLDDQYTDVTWYLADARGKKAHEYLVGLCREMRARQATLLDNTKKCIAVYQYGGDAMNIEPTDDAPLEDTMLTFNAAQNAVETVHSKVIKTRIAIMPLTEGGGYLARQRAKELGKAIEGVFDENFADGAEEDVVMDALVTDHGAGACKVFEAAGRVRIEHVPIEDVWFDEAETRQRVPRCCYHVPADGVDKFVALELWAKDGDTYPGLVGSVEERRVAILKAAGSPDALRMSRSPGEKMRLDVYEAWHLASGDVDEEGKHDGRHTICVDGATLIDEPWDGKAFPIVMYVPRKRRRSIWGLSLMRQLVAPQREYEKLTKKIQNQHQKMAVSGFSASKQAQVNVRDITSGTFGAGFVVEHDGPQAPQPFVIEPVAVGTYQYAEGIPRNMLERNGISALSATSQLPAGMGQASGKALQVFEDFESERLLPYHRERERFKIALAGRVVDVAARICEREGHYKSSYQGKKGLETLDWKEVLMDRESFVLKVFPVSQLSKQPAAKFAQLTELLNAQAITVEQFKRLYELPDLEAENELDSSDTDVIDRAMDIMVVKGRYLAPEPFDNLELIIQRAGKFYNVCRQQEVPENRLQLLRDYMEDARSLQQEAQAAEAAKNPPAPVMPPPMPGMDPMGAPPMPPGPPMPMAA